MTLYCPNNHEFTLDEAQQAFAKDRADGNHGLEDTPCPECGSLDLFEKASDEELAKVFQPFKAAGRFV